MDALSLPAGWEAKQAPDGRSYYVNHNDQSTHWTLPAAILAQAQARPVAIQAPPVAMSGGGGLPPNWEKKIDPTGRAYYVNHATQVTQWDPPAGAAPAPAPSAISSAVMDVFAPRAPAPLQPSMSADEAFARRLQEEMSQGGGGGGGGTAGASEQGGGGGSSGAADDDAALARQLAEQFAAEDAAGGSGASGGGGGGDGGGDPPNDTLINVKLNLVKWSNGIVLSYDASSETHTLYLGANKCQDVKMGGRRGRPFEKIEESRARFEVFVELLVALEKQELDNATLVTSRLVTGLCGVLAAQSGVLSTTEADASGFLDKLKPFGGTLKLFTMLVAALEVRSAAAAAAEALVALATLVMAVPDLRPEVFAHIIECDGVSALILCSSTGPPPARSHALQMLSLLIEDASIRETFLVSGGVSALAKLDSFIGPMQLEAAKMLALLMVDKSAGGVANVEVMRQARAAGVFAAIPALLRSSDGAAMKAALKVLTVATTSLLDGPGGGGAAGGGELGAMEIDQNLVNNLVEFGFDRELAAIALARSGSDVNAAYELLATGSILPGGAIAADPSSVAGELSDNTVDKQRMYSIESLGEARDAVAALSALLSYEDGTVRTRAVSVLHALAAHGKPAVLAKFVSIGVTRSVVAMSSKHADAAGVTPQVLTILTRIAQSSPAALRSVVDNGGTQLAVMHLHDQDRRTVELTTALMGLLASAGAAKSREAAQVIRDTGGIAELVNDIAAIGGDLAARTRACDTLAQLLAADPRSVLSAAESGAVHACANLCLMQPTSSASHCLGMLMTNPSVLRSTLPRATARELDKLVQASVQMLQTSDAQTQSAGVAVMAAIIDDSLSSGLIADDAALRARRNAAVNMGALPLLLPLLQPPSSQENASNAIRCLAGLAKDPTAVVALQTTADFSCLSSVFLNGQSLPPQDFERAVQIVIAVAEGCRGSPSRPLQIVLQSFSSGGLNSHHFGTVAQCVSTICVLSSRPNLASCLAPAESMTRLAELLQMDLHLADISCDSNQLVINCASIVGVTSVASEANADLAIRANAHLALFKLLAEPHGRVVEAAAAALAQLASRTAGARGLASAGGTYLAYLAELLPPSDRPAMSSEAVAGPLLACASLVCREDPGMIVHAMPQLVDKMLRLVAKEPAYQDMVMTLASSSDSRDAVWTSIKRQRRVDVAVRLLGSDDGGVKLAACEAIAEVCEAYPLAAQVVAAKGGVDELLKMLQATHDTYAQRAAAIALAPLCCAASDPMLKPEAVLILLRLLCDRSPTATETRVAALDLFARLREACTSDAVFWKAIDTLPTGRLTLLRGLSAMLMSSPAPAASVLATFPLPSKEEDGSTAPVSETDARAAQHCIVAVVGLLARPPNISPRRSTPGRSSAGGDEEVDESAIILRSTLNALVRLAATASDPSAALLDEPMALPALVEALTTSESGSGSTATATRPFDTEVRSAMLQVLADALVSSAGEGSGGSFGDANHWDVVRMLLVNKMLLPTLVKGIDVAANRLPALRCFSAFAAGDANARRSVAACDNLLSHLVAAMQPYSPPKQEELAQVANVIDAAPTVAATSVVAAVVATTTAPAATLPAAGIEVAAATVVATAAIAEATAVVAEATAIGGAAEAEGVIEGGAVAAVAATPPPSYTDGAIAAAGDGSAAVPDGDAAAVDMVAAVAAALTIAALASLDELRESIANTDGLIASIVDLLRLGVELTSDDSSTESIAQCVAVAAAATQALPHLLLVAPTAVNEAGACDALVAWISATPPNASAAAYAQALTSLEAMCYLSNEMALAVIQSGIAFRPALLEMTMPLNLRVAALKLLSAVIRCGERPVCEAAVTHGTVGKLCDILAVSASDITLALLIPVLIETLTIVCAFAPARLVVRQREDAVSALQGMDRVPAARRLSVRIGTVLSPIGLKSPRAGAGSAGSSRLPPPPAVRSGRGAGSFGGADELSQASRGNAARREKIAQLLGLNLCKSAHVAAAALDKAGGNVDVAAAHLIEGSAPVPPSPRGGQGASASGGGSGSETITIQVTVPPNFKRGQMLRATTPDGQTHEIAVPDYAGPGQSFQVTVPSRGAAASAPASTSREVSVQVPLSWIPGTALMVSGPDGQTLRINPPPTTRPGDNIRVRYPSS